jgi:predicted dehydrogenase
MRLPGSIPEFDVKDIVGQRYSLSHGRTISLLEDDLVRHRLAQRSLLLADSKPPQMRCRVEDQRDFREFPSDERPMRFVIPIEFRWSLLGCAHYFASALYRLNPFRLKELRYKVSTFIACTFSILASAFSMVLSSSINVGIVGLGWPGERHAEAVNASSLGTVHSACDLNEERLNTFAASFGPRRVFTSFDEMLADSDVDAIVISLPNSLHFPCSLKALQSEKHVLCEKPPTMNAAQMRTLHEEAQKRGLIYYFGRQMRFSPAMQTAKRLVAERRLGEIYFAETMWVRSRGTPAGLDGWFTERSKAGGGVVIDLGIHAIDAAWYLMGTPQPRAVSAQTYQKFPQFVKNKTFDVEDNAYGIIRFENGATLLFKTSWSANLTNDIPLSPQRGRSLFTTTTYGPKGSLKVTDVFNIDSSALPSALAFFEDQDGTLMERQIKVKDLRGDALRAYEFAEQDRNFLLSIRGDESAVNSSSQAIQLMEILDAIYRSSQLGKEVLIG